MEGLKIPIEVTVARLEKQLAGIVNKANNAAGKIQTGFEKANNGTERSFKRSGFAVANLSAQLNDIGVSLAGGQSPFQVMIQQGTQVSQIFQQTGGNFKQFTELLKGSVLGVLNPFSIATFAIIGFGGAILQWFTKTEDVSKDTAESIKDLEKAIGDYEKATKDATQTTEDLAEKYGLATSEAREFLKISEELARITALEKLSATLKSIGTDVDSFFSVSRNIEDIRASIDSITAAKEQLAKTGETFLNIDLATQKNIDQLATKFGVTNKEAADLFEILSRLSQANGPAEQLAVFDELLPRIKETSGGVENMSDEMRTLYAQFLQAAQGAAVLAGDVANIAPGIEEAANAAKRLADELMDASNAAKSAMDSAREGLEDSQIELKYKNDPVSLAAAKAELEFDRKTGDVSGFDPIVKKVFEENRSELVETAKATARARIELDEYRKAQAKLTREQNKKPKKTPDQKFDENIASADRRVDSIFAEYDALVMLNPLINDYGNALEYARVKQELLNNAEKQGVELTPDRLAAIEAIAKRSAMGVEQLGRLTESQSKLKSVTDDLRNSTKGYLSSFISDLRNGVSASDALTSALGRIGDKLTELALNQIFDGAGTDFFGTIAKFFTAGPTIGSPTNITPGLSSGGYTGPGHKYQVKGQIPVHGNEFVMSSHAVDRIGLKNLEKMNKGGFASGGYSGGGKASFGSQNNGNIIIQNYNSGQNEVTATRDPLTGVAKIAIKAVKDDYANGGFDTVRESITGSRPLRKKR